MMQIHFEDRLQETVAIKVVIDVTECPIERPAISTQRQYYSGKAKSHTVKYEVGCGISIGHIVWTSRLFTGSTHDLRIARSSGLLDQIGTGERLLADKAYNGEHTFVTPMRGRWHQLSENQREYNKLIGKKRVIIEHVNARLKIFHVLSVPFRGEVEDHNTIFNVIAQLVNIDIKIHPLRRR